MKIGDIYHWEGQPERLEYIGKNGRLHQFAEVGRDVIWCEVIAQNLHNLEKIAERDAPDAVERLDV